MEINHLTDYVEPSQVGKVYLIGSAGEFLDDLYGFGMINAIISGVTAANCIINNLDFNQVMKPLKDNIKKKHEFRTGINTLNNKGHDIVFAIIHFPIIKQLIFNNPLFRLTLTTPIMKAYNYHGE